ncbi:rhodanese-like domain-containing protein [Leifsonia sp. NPDC077715]|uniref:sulfurtransferase n=1 Tax=Leifsonia sp. NPDC077715 TaxID=3155539 RepID=UPI00342D01D2
MTITERTGTTTSTATTAPAGATAASAGPAAALAAALDGPLVSTQWLADHLGADGLVVLDATVVPSQGPDGRPVYLSGRDRFLGEGHIPGSVFADLLETFSDPTGRFPFTRPEAAAFEAAAAELGIGADTTVVVADAAVGQWAARLWYLFRSLGHDRVAVLDGGVKAWRAEGRPLEQSPERPAAPGDVAPLLADPRPGFWISTEEVAEIVAGTRPGALVCGTPPRDFAARHIPGSLSAPAVRLVDRDTNTLLPERELRELFADVLDAPGPIVVYCGAGIAAASDALALGLLGRDDVLLYDGSLSEWAADPAAPLASAA